MARDWDVRGDELAAEAIASGDPTAWFDRLYREGEIGAVSMPWDRDDPNPLLREWAQARGLDGTGRTAVVVGCGLGADAEYLAGLGFATTAFDVAPTAVRLARHRHPDSTVRYGVADLLDLPSDWRASFDLVVEIFTLQALPDPPRSAAITAVSGLVAAGGTLLAIAFRLTPDADPLAGPPFALPREVMEELAIGDLRLVTAEALDGPRWRVEYRLPPVTVPESLGTMDLDSGAGLLHRLTCYVPDREWDVPVDDPRVRHDLQPNDPDTLPPPVKQFPDSLPLVELPRDLPDPGVSASAVLAGRHGERQPLDAAQLGRILFLGAGVVRTAERRGRRFLFRAAGSAGARFPLEVYASTRDVAGVPDGVHWYDAVRHALVQVGPAATGDVTTLVVTGVPWRTGWRYAERGWRHLYWDAGTLLSHLQAAAASAGFDPGLRTLFPDASVRDLVGADGVHELPLALLTVGAGVPAIRSTGPADRGDLPAVELPLCTQAQRAGERDELGAPWPVGQPRTDVLSSESLDQVIRRRGSQRRMDRAATLPRQLLEWPMDVALRGIDVPHWVAVHGVDDVEPGLYRWPDLSEPVRSGDLRRELERICLGQSLAAEAAYVVIAAAPAAVLDDRSYRQAQLAAGLVEGRLHLAAYALGASATGMTFLDSEVPALLGEPHDLVTLLFTCVGVPEYTSRAGGAPGQPVEVRPVMPRMAENAT